MYPLLRTDTRRSKGQTRVENGANSHASVRETPTRIATRKNSKPTSRGLTTNQQRRTDDDNLQWRAQSEPSETEQHTNSSAQTTRANNVAQTGRTNSRAHRANQKRRVNSGANDSASRGDGRKLS